MHRLQHHDHAFGANFVRKQVGDLGGQALLDLGAVGEIVDDPGQF